MALDMTNSYASYATVRVLVSFYLMWPPTILVVLAPEPRRSKEINAPLSGDEHNDLFNFVKHLKTFTGLEIAKPFPYERFRSHLDSF